jgi:hypothetical protein
VNRNTVISETPCPFRTTDTPDGLILDIHTQSGQPVVILECRAKEKAGKLSLEVYKMNGNRRTAVILGATQTQYQYIFIIVTLIAFTDILTAIVQTFVHVKRVKT